MIDTAIPVTLTRLQVEHLPNFKVRGDEAHSACPFCNAGEDRFIFWPDRGNYYCRQCERKGFLSDAPGDWSAEDRTKFMQEAADRAAREREAKRAALDLMAGQALIAERYHLQLTDRAWWYAKGVTDWGIDEFNLGYCPSCPTFRASPSYTIPVYFKGKLLNIRHRLVNPATPGDKYRPEMAGLPALLFGADILLDDMPYVVIVEGEIKTIVLRQYGILAVGIPGANIFPSRWAQWFGKQRLVYVALDPGANGHAADIAQVLGDKARVVALPCKPDDFITVYGGSPEQLEEFLKMGRPR